MGRPPATDAERTARFKTDRGRRLLAKRVTRYQASPKGREAARRYRERHAPTLKVRAELKLAELRGIRDQAKSVPCSDCGGRFDPVCMDFDHRPDTTKLYDVGWLVNRKISTAVLLAEIAKCEVVCSNCHRLRTKNRKMQGAIGDITD